MQESVWDLRRALVGGCGAQSRVGPVEWLKPYTDVTIQELGRSGVKSLLAVPIRYVSCGGGGQERVMQWP